MSYSSLARFRDCHKGENIIVSGLGVSAVQLKHPECFITIGVNDIGRLYTPTYLVVLNSLQSFEASRREWIAQSRALTVFSQEELKLAHSELFQFRLGKVGGTELTDDALPYSNNSPYVAIQIARLMGARRIGVLGLDFTDDHFFASTGPHELIKYLPRIEQDYAKLLETLKSEGVGLYNLSPSSKLKSLPKLDVNFEDWLPITNET